MAAAEDVNNSQGGEWKKRESFGSAMGQIALVAVLLAGGVFFYWKNDKTKKDVSERMKAIRAIVVKDNPSDLQQALKQLDEVLQVKAESPEALSMATGIYTEQWLIHKLPGADAKAKDFLSRATKADARGEDRHASQALILTAEGKAKEAESYIEEQRKKGATSPKLFYAQGLALKSQGNTALAKPALNSAMEKAWRDPLYACGLGDLLLEEGSWGQAFDTYAKGLTANPEHVRSTLGMAAARIYRRMGGKESVEVVTKLLANEAEMTPGLKARALAILAEAANVEARYDDAIKQAELALQSNPDDTWALFAKARALAYKKDPGASAAFDQLIAKAGTAPVFFFDGALLLQGAGQSEAALALLAKYENFYQNIKNTAPDGTVVGALDRDDRYWLAKGDVLRSANKLDDAMAAYDKAVAAKNVNVIRAQYARGSVFIAKKDFDSALKELMPITPADGTGALAEAYVAMGDTQFAKKEYAAGCQNYAFALTKMKQTQVPREQLNAMLTDVEKRLAAAGQKAMSQAWVKEAKPIIQ